MAERIMGTANKSHSGAYEAVPVSADKGARQQRDRAPQTANTTIGMDFAALSAVEGQASKASGMAAGGLSPMMARAAPTAGVTQMKKGGPKFYGNGKKELGANKMAAGGQARKLAQKRRMEDDFSTRMTNTKVEMSDINNAAAESGGFTPEQDARMQALDQQYNTIKAEMDAQDDGSLRKFEPLSWNNQKTPEQARANFKNIVNGASSLNPYLISDQYLAQNFMQTKAESEVYSGLIGNLRGMGGLGEDENGQKVPEMVDTLNRLRYGSQNEQTDIAYTPRFLEGRFMKIKKTGSSEGWEDDALGLLSKDMREKAKAALARMKAQSEERLAEKGGRKRWMKE